MRLPINPYDTGEYLKFGDVIRRRLLLWAVHLGDDVKAEAGTEVKAVSAGDTVLSEMKSGSEERKNWGGLVIVEHHNDKLQITSTKSQTNSKFQIPNSKTFYSVYGHMGDLRVGKGDEVEEGDVLGEVAPGNTPENGYWKHPHLHFGIYTGPWTGRVLPGYWRPDDWLLASPRRTRLKWWHDPREFVSLRQ